MFAIGLLAVVHYRYLLYTGTAGFVNDKKGIIDLFTVILPGNFIGCAIVAALAYIALPDIVDADKAICMQRSSVEWYSALVRGLFCGFLMTLAVKFGREGKFLPLLFGVPVFILSGFYHSIADTFYICLGCMHGINSESMMASIYTSPSIYTNWVVTILGNFVGCNIYRICPSPA